MILKLGGGQWTRVQVPCNPAAPGGIDAHLVYLDLCSVPVGEDASVRRRGAALRASRCAAGASRGLIALLVLLLLIHHLAMAAMPMGSMAGEHATPAATMHLATVPGSPSAHLATEGIPAGVPCTDCLISCPLTRGSLPPRGPDAARPPAAIVRQAAPSPAGTLFGALLHGTPEAPTARARCAILQVFRI